MFARLSVYTLTCFSSVLLLFSCEDESKANQSSLVGRWEIVKGFRNHFGSIIANGQGTMKGQIFRIAHLGYFDFADLFAMVAELELILHSKGVPVEFGKGVAAVQKIYAASALKAK